MKVLTSFLGVDKTVAQTQIVSEGFTVGTVTQSDSTDSAEGPNHNKVIIQSPVSSSLIDYDSPISITWRNFSFTPAPYSFTPAPPYTFTPAPPYTFVPAPPYTFTPAPPYTFTPAPPEKYYSYAYCQNGSARGYTAMYLSISGYATVAEACSATQAALAPYGISNWICEEGTQTGPDFEAQYNANNTCVVAPPPTGGTIPNVVGLHLNIALPIIVEEGFQNAPTQGNSSVGATAQNHQKVKSQNPAAGTIAPFNTNVQLVLYYFNESAPFSFTPAPTYSFTPTPTYSFVPYSFVPYSFVPAPPYSFVPAPPYSFTPSGFTGCRGAKPYPYCVCQSNSIGSPWVC